MSFTKKFKPQPGEQLYLYRKRKGLSQRQMATGLKVSLKTYREMEGGNAVVEPAVLRQYGTQRPDVHEVCALLRIRRGLKQVELAGKVKVCRYWLMRMERGEANPRRLVDYWSKKAA